MAVSAHQPAQYHSVMFFGTCLENVKTVTYASNVRKTLKVKLFACGLRVDIIDMWWALVQTETARAVGLTDVLGRKHLGDSPAQGAACCLSPVGS